MNADTGVETSVVVEDDGERITYRMPDGEVHKCRHRDENGIAECTVVNRRATKRVV